MELIKLTQITPAEGIKRMQTLCKPYWKKVALYSQMEVITPKPTDMDMILRFPGRKEYGDYKLFCNRPSWKAEKCLTHSDVCKYIVDLVNKDIIPYPDMLNILEDVYENGLQDEKYPKIEAQLRLILFWVTLQEEINYPHNSFFEGRQLAFKRYAEALDTTLQESQYSLKYIRRRAKSHKIKHYNLLKIINAPSFYTPNPLAAKNTYSIIYLDEGEYLDTSGNVRTITGKLKQV